MKEHFLTEYRPTEEEEYMCINHRQYFKQKLIERRKELMSMFDVFIENLKENKMKGADIIDQSAMHSEILLDFSTSERQCKLVHDIDLALERLETGDFGYCEITGEEIGLKRLEAQPAATRCIEAQQQFERLASVRTRLIGY